jgi:hypothetical protein
MTAAIERIQCGYRSIFTPATRRERAANFEAYWAYSVEHDGEILEDQQGLRKKQQIPFGPANRCLTPKASTAITSRWKTILGRSTA